ncbi:MAG: type II toxin-antitoxin system RelE/ParE family toxin [Candidatus Acidiferrales bacterium]
MAYKLTYHPQALITLEEIFDWSMEHHPGTTESFGDSLFEHLDRLASFPRIGVIVQQRPGIRRLSHPPLHIYYRVDENRQVIEILRFRHVSRRAPRL